MKIGPNQERWLTALETTELPQAKNRLQTADGYCCLGIACVVNGDPNPVGFDLQNHRHVVEALALRDPQGDPPDVIPDKAKDRLRRLGIVTAGLTALNDFERMTFTQIAAFVREFPELYFTEPR